MVTPEHVAHALRRINLFEEKEIRLVIALDLINCLTQIQKLRFLFPRAPISESPFTVTTMGAKSGDPVQIVFVFSCSICKLKSETKRDMSVL